MPCMRSHRHTPQCILPPYLTDSIARRGSKDQRDRILSTAARDNSLRALRLATSRMALVPKPKVPRAMVVERMKQRTVYDMQHGEAFPGTLVRSEGQPDTQDVAANEAYEYLGRTFDFFKSAFGRNSIDDDGMPLLGHVHYGREYANAFWDGQRMVFGDGDGDIFERFTIAIDVVAHELGHGVTEDESQLLYFRQAGALNESMSDVFGSLVKQAYYGHTADQADWLIGTGLFTKKVQGEALRSMKAPGTAFDDPVLGKDPQPGHMDHYVATSADNGGVHINSGIPNRAFYLAASKLGGYSWDRAGRIWYEALRDPRLEPDADFMTFARLTVQSAARLYGRGEEEDAVRGSWSEVGLSVSREKVETYLPLPFTQESVSM